MRGTAKRWAGYCAAAVRRVWRTACSAAPKRERQAVCGAAAPKRVRRTACSAAAPTKRERQAAYSAAALRRVRRIVCCTVILALCLLLCGDVVLPLRQDSLLPEFCAVERQLRALTAGAPDGWRYSLRVSSGSGGEALIADAARRDDSGAWETIHTLWVPENGAWRMVWQTRRRRCPPPVAGAEDG